MEVTLIRTGGIIPITKKAITDADWTKKEMNELINLLSIDENPGQKRDAAQYKLKLNDQTFSIDLEKIPLKYTDVFDRLKDNLQIVKPT